MYAKIEELAERYAKLEPSLENQSYSQMKENEELKYLFSELFRLMQYKEFFSEGWFRPGFQSSRYVWTPASKAERLLAAFLDISRVLTFSENSNNKLKPTKFSCQQQEWLVTTPDLALKTYLQDLRQKTGKNECFITSNPFCFEERTGDRKPNPNCYPQFNDFILQLKTDPALQGSAMCMITDNVLVEPLFFIKNNGQLEVLVASRPEGGRSCLHDTSRQIFENHNIKCIVSDAIKVDHNGDCGVHSRLNFEAILTRALEKGGSVYEVLNDIKSDSVSVPAKDLRVTLSELAPDHQGESPSAETLARLYWQFAASFVRIQAKGWMEFCKEKKIHPLLPVKSNFTNWEEIKYNCIVERWFTKDLPYNEPFKKILAEPAVPFSPEQPTTDQSAILTDNDSKVSVIVDEVPGDNDGLNEASDPIAPLNIPLPKKDSPLPQSDKTVGRSCCCLPESVTASFFMQVMSHPAVAGIAGFLLLAGLVAITVGVVLAGAGVAAAGAVSFVTGSLLLAGFFACGRDPGNKVKEMEPVLDTAIPLL